MSCCNLKLIIHCSPNKSNNWLFWSGVLTSAAFWGTLLLSRPALSARPRRGCRVCDRYQPLTPTLTIGAAALSHLDPPRVCWRLVCHLVSMSTRIFKKDLFFFFTILQQGLLNASAKKSGNVLKIIQNGAQVKLAQSARKLWHTIKKKDAHMKKHKTNKWGY